MCKKESTVKIQREIETEQIFHLSFVDVLDKLIKLYNFTLSSLAEKCGVSVETIKRYHNGDSVPDIKMAVAICLAFELDLEKSEQLLNTLGYTLAGSSKEIVAYQKLLIEHQGIDLFAANALLLKWGIAKNSLLLPRKRSHGNST